MYSHTYIYMCVCVYETESAVLPKSSKPQGQFACHSPRVAGIKPAGTEPSFYLCSETHAGTPGPTNPEICPM